MKQVIESIFDIVDDSDHLTGKTAGYFEVVGSGLWHRGVHILLIGPDRKILMAKRSSRFRLHPGEIEISVGGGVDAGETPEEAILREAKEEIGIELEPGQLALLGRSKYNHHLKRSGMWVRGFDYLYAARITKSQIKLIKTNDEVEDIFWVSPQLALRAMLRHHFSHHRHVVGVYSLWRRMIIARRKLKTTTRIHIICRGNTFRSRMAEAIIRSRQLRNFSVSSSGINADEDQNGKIAYWGKMQLKKHKKLNFAANSWRQTTQSMIDEADIVVVVAPDIYREMAGKWHIPKQKLRVWRVHDLEETIIAEGMSMSEKNKAMVSERIYNQLDSLTNELLVSL